MKILTCLAKYAKWGGSWAAIVPPLIREHLQLRPGDVLQWHLVGNYAVVQRWTPGTIPWQNEKQVERAIEQRPVVG
jgi:antitoxin component of MazEF toxin-antitoxin module